MFGELFFRFLHEVFIFALFEHLRALPEHARFGEDFANFEKIPKIIKISLFWCHRKIALKCVLRLQNAFWTRQNVRKNQTKLFGRRVAKPYDHYFALWRRLKFEHFLKNHDFWWKNCIFLYFSKNAQTLSASRARNNDCMA